MTVDLFTFVGLYGRALDTAGHLLTKGAAFALERGIPEDDMLEWRLIEDMHPLRFQLMVVTNFAWQWPARVAGLPVPPGISADATVDGFQHAIEEAKRYLAALKPEQFDGRDEVPLSFEIGEDMKPTMPASQWLTVFATTNLFFHLSTAYGIMRAEGVPIGKADMFANRL